MIRRGPALPEPGQRWTPARKAAVVAHLQINPHQLAEILTLYDLSVEELWGWSARLSRHGHAGLKVTKLQAVGR